MTDTNKIVAAIFAAGMCNKVGASSDDYLNQYHEILKKIEEHEKPPKHPTFTNKTVEQIKRAGPRSRS